MSRRLPQRMLVQGRTKQDQQTRLEAHRAPRSLLPRQLPLLLARLRDLAPPKHLLRVADRPRQPLGHAVPVRAQALGVAEDGLVGPLEAADEDDGAVGLDDVLDDLGRAAEGGEGLAEVEEGEVGAGAVDLGERGAVGELGGVAEVGAGGEEVRGSG